MSSFQNLMTPDVRANPYTLYAELREKPVCQVDPGGMWAVSRYQDVVAVLRDPVRFSSAGLAMSFRPPWLERNPTAESLVMKDPPEHTRLRGFVSRAFSTPALALLEPKIRAIAEDLAERAAEKQEIDFMADFALPLPARVLSLVFGLDQTAYPRLKVWADDLLSIPGGHQTPERQEAIRESLAAMERHFNELLAKRSEAPRNDLVSDLLRAEQEGQTTRQETMSFLFGIVPAGLETTVYLLGNTMTTLAQHPKEMAQVLADLSLIPKLTEEMLRFEPPAHTSLRLVTEDVELSGVTIPKGSVVVVLLASALRDERQYPDADRFLLDRNKPISISFGHGVHHCIGAALARLEARLGLEALFSRIKGFTLATREIPWCRSLIARGPTSLPMHLESRSVGAPRA